MTPKEYLKKKQIEKQKSQKAFLVTLRVEGYYDFRVVANTEEEAIRAAKQEIDFVEIDDLDRMVVDVIKKEELPGET